MNKTSEGHASSVRILKDVAELKLLAEQINGERNWAISFSKEDAAAILELLAQRDELLAALEFYADESRYHGPNQSLDEPDAWSEKVGLQAYRLDVTRDGGVIARAAIEKVTP